MKFKNVYMFCLTLSLFILGQAHCSSLKQTPEGKYTLENEYLEVKINPKQGGSIENIRYKPQNLNLTCSTATRSASDVSFEDRIYNQSDTNNEKVVNIEYFKAYPFTPKILKNTKKEVSIEVSAKSLTDTFSGLIVSKVYTLKENVPALFVEHKLENRSTAPITAGIWSTNFFRTSGALPERNTYFTPTEEGVKEITHPGVEATPDGVWTFNSVSNWKGVVGDTTKSGMAVIFEEKHISSFLDWFSTSDNIATFEWVIKQHQIKPAETFKTTYVMAPIINIGRVDGVIGDRIAAGIEFTPKKVATGKEVEITYRLYNYENEDIEAKVRLKNGNKVIKENPPKKIKMLGGTSFSETLKGKIEKNGVYWAEVEVSKGNKVVGVIKRPLIVGEVKSQDKPKALKNLEEKFWLGLKMARVEGWQDVKLVSQRVAPSKEEKAVKNLVNLGDFEEKDITKYAKEKWKIQFGKGATLTEEAAHSGKQSVQILVPSDSKTSYVSVNAPLCKVEAGKEYKVTCWAKAIDAIGGSYVLLPRYYYYKGSREKPQYVGRYQRTIETPTFDWQKIERIVTIPEGAEWLEFSIGTRSTMGKIFIDDISIYPVSTSAKEARKERAYIYNKSLDSFFNVSEECETPHIKWLKTYSKGKIKVLYMSYMWRLCDHNKRDIVELN